MGASSETRRRGRWPILIPLLALLYLPFIGGGPLTDDFVHLLRVESASWAEIVSQPDAFRFYRPVTQATLKLQTQLHGSNAPAFRAVNLALHAAVLALALVVARLLLSSELAGALAALTFALTPKAPAIAVLWISGRAELLMALFTFASVAAWIAWRRSGRTRWLVAAASAYVLAALSKETGFLVPLVLLVIPDEHRPRAARRGAIALLFAIGAVLIVLRTQAGAMTPLSADAHYDLLTGIARITRSLRNYTARMIGLPAALVVFLVIARAIDRRRTGTIAGTVSIRTRMLVLPLVWVLAFIAPVLPIVARSEIYLYLPVFGVALLAAVLGLLCCFGQEPPRLLFAALTVMVVTVGGYQASRASAMSRDLQFSAQLVDAVRADPDFASRTGDVTIVPADAATEQRLRDSIGGYLSAVLRYAFPDGHLTGTVQYPGMTATGSSHRVTCAFRDGRLTLIHQRE